MTLASLNRSIGLALSALRYAKRHGLCTRYRYEAVACLNRARKALKDGHAFAARLYADAASVYMARAIATRTRLASVEA